MTRRENILPLYRRNGTSESKSLLVLRLSTWARRIIAGVWLVTSTLLARTTVAETYYPPPEAMGDWRSLVKANGTPTEAEKRAVADETGLDWDKLQDAWRFVQSFGGTNSLLVIRKGWIAAEWNALKGPIAIHSCTKSLTALAMAKLFDLSDAGQLSRTIGTDSFAYQYLPASWGDSDPRRKLIRIRHLMTMSSGLYPWDGGSDTEGIPRWEFHLTRPVVAAPESVWAYNSLGVDLLSLIVENVSGQLLEEFFNQKINAAIGIPPVEWWRPYGHSCGSGGAKFTARQLARVGYLAMQKGAWDNGRGPQQVVSAARISLLTHWAPQLAGCAFLGGEPTPTRKGVGPEDSHLCYGYLWWTNRAKLGLGSVVPEDAYFMSGYGGQICAVIPSANMVIVRLGIGNEEAVNAGNANREFYHELCRRIMGAMVDPPPVVNAAPAVAAGPDRTAAAGQPVALDGAVHDDGLPGPPGRLAVVWSKVSGPGEATFGNPNAADTTATFSAPGTYVLRLNAKDGEISASDDLAVTVTNAVANPRPSNVERWDVHEVTLTASNLYANPFQDVDLTATFIHEASKTRITVDGFHDGGSEWRIRFMPTQIGTWRWTTRSNDRGLDGKMGTIECVTPKKPYLHGAIMTDGFHFKHADGSRKFLISTRLSCQFDDPKNWNALVDYLKNHKINRVFFMLVGNTSQSGLQWQDPKAGFGKVLYGRDFDDQDASRFHIDAWRRIDNFIEKLRVNDIIASPYFYYFNDGFQRTMTPEQDDLFIRYGMARFGSFSNVMPVLGNQIDHKSQKKIHEGYDLDYTWQNEKGSLLKKLAVYGQVVTVHNPAEGRTVNPSFWTALFANPFPFADCLLKQGQVAGMGDVKKMDGATPEFDDDDGDGKPECSAAKDLNERAFARNNQFCIDMRNRYKKPIVNEEPGYDFEVADGYAWNAQNHNTIRATFWTAAMGGGYAAWGSKATYANGDNRAYPQMAGNLERHSWAKDWGADPLRAMKLTPTAAYLKIHHDFMAALPYWEMAPDNSIVGGPTKNIEGEEFRTAFCLKKDNAQYVVYVLVGGTITLNVPQGNWHVQRLNPRDGSTIDLGTHNGGQITIALPESHPTDFRAHTGDWVLHLSK